MRTRFSWILGVTALISIGMLIACSTKYSSSANGLVVVATQGSAVMDTFSLDLGNGHITEINNVNGPPTPGVPTAVVLDPKGGFAYVMVTANADIQNSVSGVATYSVASDGKLALSGSTTAVAGTSMTIDSQGNFLFVATGTGVSVFSISNGTLTAAGSVTLPVQVGGQIPNASALAVSPTLYPPAYAPCSANVPPTTEHLYVTDSLNYVILNYSVSSSGALTLVPTTSNPGVSTGNIPAGVAVDPCNRFVYVSNSGSGTNGFSVSAYTICNSVSLPVCTQPDFSLHEVAGSPFAAGNTPGPLLEDTLGGFLYVLDQGQNAISAFRISTASGALAPLTPATFTTNSFPTAMAIRSDDSWMFVTNLNSMNVSQFGVTPATGVLVPQPPFQTDNNPWGIAVK
jgi:6-phosphogluconolactonase (cycloisomerase 2 family)